MLNPNVHPLGLQTEPSRTSVVYAVTSSPSSRKVCEGRDSKQLIDSTQDWFTQCHGNVRVTITIIVTSVTFCLLICLQRG